MKRRVNGPNAANVLIYVENGAICGTETAKLTGCFVSQANSRYIWSFYKHHENRYIKPEDHWSCIAHLSAEGMLKSAVIEEKKFKHSTWAGADNPLGPKF